MYSLEHLRMFVTTAEAGSFSECARRLGRVQSAISQGIASLEIDLDTRLFDRSTRKPSLTEEGVRLLSYARAVLQQEAELSAAADAIGRKEESLIRIALDTALMVPNFIQILADFEQLFPATEIELTTLASSDVNRYVSENQADLGLAFVDHSFNRDVELCFIGSLPVYAVCHTTHSLATCSEIKASDLVAHRQLIPRGEDKRIPDQLPQLSAKVWWANDFECIKTLLLKGVGWSYLPGHMVEEEINQHQLKRLMFSFDHKTWSPPIDMATVKNQVKGPALSWLHQSLKSMLD